MKIIVVGSVEKADQIIEVVKKLEEMGYTVEVPHTINRIRNKEISLEEFKNQKIANGGDFSFRQKSNINYFKRYFDLIRESDAVLVLNFTKNGIENYIGGNALMELGFAHVLDKPIYLYNPVPKMSYTDEIMDVRPVIINGDLSKIA